MMNWIIKPNKWYDKQKEPYRLSLLILIVFILVLTLGSVIGSVAIGLIGVYRIAYVMIMSKKKEVKL